MLNYLEPAFSENNIPIAFAVTNNYVPYFGVCLQSIIDNSSYNNNYDIVILEDNITQENKRKLQQILPSNFSIRYVNMKQYINNVDISKFYLSGHITIATYYRFFIPDIFRNYKKIIYLDSDLVVTTDISELFNYNIHNYVLAASLDPAMCAFLKARKNYLSYAKDIMRLPFPYYCFNAGVLICNISMMISNNFIEKCIKKLDEIKETWSWDQDILNSLFYNNYFLLEQSWNTQWHTNIDNNLKKCLPSEILVPYQDACKDPKVIHYTSSMKAWNSPDKPLAEYFWKIARKSIFYEEILKSNLSLKNYNCYNKKEINKSLLKSIFYCKSKTSTSVKICFLGIPFYTSSKKGDVVRKKILNIQYYKKTKFTKSFLGITFFHNYKSEIELLKKRERLLRFSYEEFQQDAINYIQELKLQAEKKTKFLKKKVNIFCTYHYQDGYPTFQSDIYYPIQTGASLSNENFGYLKDNIGDNISDKNEFYAELTATYWVWKNWLRAHPDVEYIGAAHHYNHLDIPRLHPLQRQGVSIYPISLNDFVKEFSFYTLDNINIEECDIILPKKIKYKQIGLTLFSQYCQCHPKEMFEQFENIVKIFHPECTNLLSKFRDLSEFYLGNSYIMKRSLFEDYCEWLFPMLFELERKTNCFAEYRTYLPKKKRIPPFLSERFINLWLMEKNEHLKIGERTWLKIVK